MKHLSLDTPPTLLLSQQTPHPSQSLRSPYLVAVNSPHAEVVRSGVRQVHATDGSRRRHCQRLRQPNAAARFHVHCTPQSAPEEEGSSSDETSRENHDGLLLGMVGLCRISRRWSNALVLDINQLLQFNEM